MSFQDKTIWLTGASSGIGEALAIEWSKHQPKLILSGRNVDRLNSVKHKCEENGAQCQVVVVDLVDTNSIKIAAREVLKTNKAVDILVHNGGISQRSMSIETPVDVDRKVLETNFFGAITLTKEVLPSMVENGGGRFVIISSISGKFGFPLRTAYSASKHALQGYFESLRAEMTSDKIKVLMVSPGRIKTNISLNAIDKEGEKHGVMDAGQANGMAADKCARKIIRAVKHDKKDILIGRIELLLVFIHKYLPSLYYILASKVKAT